MWWYSKRPGNEYQKGVLYNNMLHAVGPDRLHALIIKLLYHGIKKVQHMSWNEKPNAKNSHLADVDRTAEERATD